VSTRQDRKLARVKLQALQPHAYKFDVDALGDHARPGNKPSECAYHLLSCGFELLITMMDCAFPSFDKGVQKLARKRMREHLLFKGAETAGFLARATPTLSALMGGPLSDEGEDAAEAVVDPEYHLFLRQTVEDFYPNFKLTQFTKVDRLVTCMGEFEVLEKGEPREEVAAGDEPASPYSLALLRGEDPSEDPELVEMQRRYARDYFIWRATDGAMRSVLHPADRRRFLPKTIQVLDPADPRLLEYRRHALATWIEGSRPYREYALMEFQHASASAAATPVGMQPR
jgi:hypothetical protein